MKIGYNEKYLIKDGKPWFLVMGEYEYSRSDCRYWKDGILKMKALGCNAVQSYVIWSHHEEIEGKFNFRGNNNLRKFIREIKDAGMLMCLRIGPWVHGEVRNGGFPDWMFEKNMKTRTDDPEYMAVLERYLREIYKQCEGYMLEDGGPIFSIQVENEYQKHAWGGAQTREDGDRHVNNVIALIEKIGFKVPIYLATAWGDAAIGNALPCWGGYCEAPWEGHINPQPPSANYLIKHNPNASPIGEYEDKPLTTQDFTVSKQNYPYLTIEQGAGVQMTKIRRPISLPEDNGAMTMCRIAQGVANLGYYVYHGGMNPVGALSTMQEYYHPKLCKKYWGFACDLSEINYDFQGAISMYGKMKGTGYELKLWAMLAREFEDVLTPADTFLPADAVEDPKDFTTLRYAIRKYGNSGMAFFNNFVRRYDVTDKTVENFKVKAGEEEIAFPTFTLKNKQYCAYPFNLKVGDMTVKYATATPFCVLNGKDLVLWSDTGSAEIAVENMTDNNIIVLTKEQALSAFKLNNKGREYIVIANGEVYEKDGEIMLGAECSPVVKIYPAVDKLTGFTKVGMDGGLAVFSKNQPEKAKVSFVEKTRTNDYADYEISITYAPKCDNAYLNFDFDGDSADLIVDGEKVSDTFYNGVPYEVGAKHHNFPTTLTLRVFPLKNTDHVFVEKKPEYDENGVAMKLKNATISTEKIYTLKF
ncbi:MAG: beta-galactosidase [Clostridia bacterium]|nr:beta-galactosidase [Clostridia bacterium]